MTINLPFGRMACVTGEPIWVPREADEALLEAKRQEVETALNKAFIRAYELAGASPSRATPAIPDPNAPAASPGMLLKSYRAGMIALRPGLPLLLKLRERQGKGVHRPGGDVQPIGRLATPAGNLSHGNFHRRQ